MKKNAAIWIGNHWRSEINTDFLKNAKKALYGHKALAIMKNNMITAKYKD